MKQVSVVRVTRRKIATTVLGTLVATVAVQGIANAQPREVSVSTLGGATRFSPPMHGVEDLRAMATPNRTQITSVLGQAGLGDLSTPMLNVLTTGLHQRYDGRARHALRVDGAQTIGTGQSVAERSMDGTAVV